MSNELLLVALATMMPISELRGAIPLGASLGIDLTVLIPLVFIINCLIFFPIYFGLNLFYEKVFSKWRITHRIFGRIRRKGSKYIEKYEILGLAVFVGIPLPVTGVWSGTVLAWILGLEWKKSFISISLGVVLATTIVSLFTLGLFNGLGII
jgi:uncharacterized membrane protein